MHIASCGTRTFSYHALHAEQITPVGILCCRFLSYYGHGNEHRTEPGVSTRRYRSRSGPGRHSSHIHIRRQDVPIRWRQEQARRRRS